MISQRLRDPISLLFFALQDWPNAEEKLMTQHDDDATRAALLAERAQIEREIAEYTHGEDAAFPSPPHDTTDADVGDEADAADDLEDDERNQGIVAVLRDRLAEIDAALARMDASRRQD